MILNEEIIKSMDSSVLCWLATSSINNVPNVSPKEIFSPFGNNAVIIANIASPQSMKNIKENPFVSLSFIDIFVQKGYQLKGSATIIDRYHNDFSEMESLLLNMTHGQFPFNTIFSVVVESVKKIIAPRYILYPDTTEKEQIIAAKKAYG